MSRIWFGNIAKALKTAAGAIAVCAMLTGTAACGSAQAQEVQDNVISVSGSEPQKPLIPGDTYEPGGMPIVFELFSGLVSANGADHKIVNEVAESITPNADATQYTVKLKDGWKFSDGTPVTSESFTKAWSYTANAANGLVTASFFSNIKGYGDLQNEKGDPNAQLSGLEVKDDHTFVINMSSPDSVFPSELSFCAFMPLPESFYKDPKAFGEKPVGNGPYKLESWKHNQSISLVKNPEYTGVRKVKNDGIDFRVYSQTTAAYSDVQGGNLDLLSSIPDEAMGSFEKVKSIKAYNKTGSNISTLIIPQSMKHFGNDEEGHLRRKAISMVIDRKNITEKIYHGTATVATDFLSPSVSAYSKNVKGNEVLQYNPDEARKLWAQADAISPWSGEFTIAYNADGNYQNWVDAVCNNIKNALGIDAKGAPVPTSSEFGEARDQRKFTGAFRGGWAPDYPSSANYLAQLYDSQYAFGKGRNDGDYVNPQFDSLIQQAYETPDSGKADELYRQSEEILFQDLPAIPLWMANDTAVTTPQVKGVGFTYDGRPVYEDLTKR